MEMEEFTRDLPTDTSCDQCGKVVRGLEWGVGRFGARDWMGVCVVKCEKCRRIKVAAAGSSNEAHHRAQMMRWQLVCTLEGRGFNPRAFH